MLVLLLALFQSPFHVETLADGVYAVVRDSPIGFGQNANSLIVVGDRDVTVVDAQFTRAATLETIAAIRRLTKKPVGHVINTHWHDDHVAGDQVYRDTFPNVRFVMQANTQADFVALGRPNRAQQLEGAPPYMDHIEHLLSMGLGGDSTPASPDERRALEAALVIVRQYIAEAPGFREMTADDTVQSAMTIGSGRNRVEVRWFGCANTRGDLVAWLPGRGILASGDILVNPVPFGFNSYPASWVGALDSILARNPRVIMPGHGPVEHDLTYARFVRTAIADLVAGHEDSLAAYRARVPLDQKWGDFLWRGFFVGPVRRAVQEHRNC